MNSEKFQDCFHEATSIQSISETKFPYQFKFLGMTSLLESKRHGSLSEY